MKAPATELQVVLEQAGREEPRPEEFDAHRGEPLLEVAAAELVRAFRELLHLRTVPGDEP
jgi:hypothetical protein